VARRAVVRGAHLDHAELLVRVEGAVPPPGRVAPEAAPRRRPTSNPEGPLPPPYRDDLAFIHDAGFAGPAEGAASVLVEDLRRHGATDGLVVELGCGSGILSERVARAGYSVLGIDLSPDMIALARRRVPAGEFRVESLLTAELPPCVAVAAVGECFNYLFDERHDVSLVREALRRIHASLRPGGLLLFDTAGPGRLPGPGPQRSHREGPGWAVLTTADEDSKLGVLTRRITTFRRVDSDRYRRDEEVHRLRLLDPDEVEAWLRELSFEVRRATRHGDFELPPGMTAFRARKAIVGSD
jgi:SAM-dependent methyltransferase